MKLKNKIIFLRKGETKKKKKEEEWREKRREQEGSREEKREGRESRKEKEKASFLDQRKMQQLMELFLLGYFPAWIADFCKAPSDPKSRIPVSDFLSHTISLLFVYKL